MVAEEALRAIEGASLRDGEQPVAVCRTAPDSRTSAAIWNLGEHFDWIVLDSPPVMAVTDAVVVAHHADGVAFMVGAEMTHRGTARRALDQLDTGEARFFGAVLNRVDLDRNPYYYAQYYRKDYAEQYAQRA